MVNGWPNILRADTRQSRQWVNRLTVMANGQRLVKHFESSDQTEQTMGQGSDPYDPMTHLTHDP